MKKIVALVLALALALSLCTVAMAYADDRFDVYAATSANLKDGALKSTATATKTNVAIVEVAAVEYKNQDNGSIAYFTVGGTGMYVKTTTPTTGDFAVTETGKTTILYYLTEVEAVNYTVAAKAFTDFGYKCGQVQNPTAGADYYVDVNDVVYVECDDDDEGAVALKVDGAVVYGVAVTTVAHKWTVTEVKLDAANATVPTKVYCPICGAASTAIYKTGKVPAGTKVTQLDAPYANYWFVVPTTAASTTTTTVDSSKTFDAGVAMYVGLSLMSVAGSAVVIGKKKEF